MINKIKGLFLLVLCAGLFGNLTVSRAQSEEGGGGKALVSAAGKTLKQSDIDSLIEFYEWAFEAQFNSAQRSDFQEYTKNEFRANPRESRKTIDDIITTLPKILASDEDVQTATRRNFLEAFLPEARKNTDENSQMLVSIYEAAAGGESRTDSSENKVENPGNSEESDSKSTSGGDVANLSALAGKWAWGRSGSMTKTTSGVYLGGNGSRHTYQFNANGTVEYTGIMNIMTAGCRMQIFRTMKGRATLSGETLTIKWSPASFSRDDTCSPSKNYKKTMPAETEVFTAVFKDSYGQKQLCLTGKEEMCLSPED